MLNPFNPQVGKTGDFFLWVPGGRKNSHGRSEGSVGGGEWVTNRVLSPVFLGSMMMQIISNSCISLHPSRKMTHGDWMRWIIDIDIRYVTSFKKGLPVPVLVSVSLVVNVGLSNLLFVDMSRMIPSSETTTFTYQQTIDHWQRIVEGFIRHP